MSSLTWHLEWTYQSCECQQLDRNNKRKHRRSSSGSHVVGEVFLGPPSALQHSRAQSPLPLPGQSAQGHGEKMIGEGTTLWGKLLEPTRRQEEETRNAEAQDKRLTEMSKLPQPCWSGGKAPASLCSSPPQLVLIKNSLISLEPHIMFHSACEK